MKNILRTRYAGRSDAAERGEGGAGRRRPVKLVHHGNIVRGVNGREILASQETIMISSARSAVARSMPMGSHYRLTGLLKHSPRGPIVEVDDGGSWVLDHDQDVRELLGRRVVVEGKRSGFDRLDVMWIGLATSD